MSILFNFLKDIFTTTHFATVFRFLVISLFLFPVLAFFAFLQGQLVIAVSYGLSGLTTEGITTIIISLLSLFEGFWIYTLIVHGFGLGSN